ncbi:hypothetical protein [Acidianus ambivalens]|uniref:Uncharacterized protein n=1 Tax=Acidianus ambivalens TaxID=2283 RepID=A0A650CV08_ACIAM|nr:hypothetical protein [Acidianus ambivalens]MQL55759.1 hypothetical protein [Acidianus ambivalens]QGR21669.1 hypothetical protein D1866_06400 [Acidianus ambivalens]
MFVYTYAMDVESMLNAHDKNMYSIYSSSYNNTLKVISLVKKCFGQYALAGQVSITSEIGISYIALCNLSCANRLIYIKPMIAEGKFPQYGIYLVYHALKILHLKLGSNITIYFKNYTIPLKVVGVLYNSYFSGSGIAILPLNKSDFNDILLCSSCIIILNSTPIIDKLSSFENSLRLLFNNTAINFYPHKGSFIFSGAISLSNFNKVLEFTESLEIVYLLLSVLMVLSIRSKLSNIIGLFIINGLSISSSFKKLLRIFTMVGIIPLFLSILYYIFVGRFWYPLTHIMHFEFDLLGIILFSIFLDYYTIYIAYSNQHRFVKVREIE